MRAAAVAPHAGAWIETASAGPSRRPRRVAPHAGAWIETVMDQPPRRPSGVAPHAGAWIETARTGMVLPTGARRPPRGGVDRNRPHRHDVADGHESPPTRGRGSKRRGTRHRRIRSRVAPHAGAWIET